MAAPKELTDYLRDAKASGMANADILAALVKSGWHAHDLLDIVLERDAMASAVAGSAITARGVKKSFGAHEALKGVDMDVRQGGVTALLGPNGAGKTTLVRIMTTLLKADAGAVTVAGLDVVRDAQKLRSVIGLTGQYAAVDAFLTGRENLELVARLYQLDKKAARQRAGELLKEFGLEEAADRPLKTYSGGMRRRLDLAASLIVRPKVLFLDEPTTGLDPRSRFQLWDVIRDLVAQGTTVLLTTQYLEEADQLAHDIYVIDGGSIIARGTAADLKKQVGGDLIDVHLADHAATEKASAVIAKFGTGQPRISREDGHVSMPVAGAAAIPDVIRELDAARIAIADISLRRPSLDDVFMKLTGRTAE